jgi:uncharacterized protein (TIGR02246 family)
MRQAILVLVGVALCVTSAYTQTRLGTAADEAAIRRNLEARIVAWNKHDAKATAALFATDADRVSTNGSFSSGRAQIEKSYANLFSDVYKNSTLKSEPGTVRFLTTDVAIFDAPYTITGATNGTFNGTGAAIHVKRNGVWELVSLRLVQKQ